MRVHEQFRGRLAAPWRTLAQGGAAVAVTPEGLRLATAGATRARYCNAQLDDYSGLGRSELPWRPPLRLRVRARFPTPILGTAGFGLWNVPILPVGGRPALPAALWFFYASPPSDMAPALGVPGSGWKAATLDLTTRAALAWAPAAPLAVLLSRRARLFARLWPRVQRALRVAEAHLGEPDPAWRDYEVEWRRDGARLSVDGAAVLETDRAPDGPLGFVAWVDTQWLVATPRGRLGWGLHDAPNPQVLDIASVEIETLV